jgi:hypothetical protein
MLSRLFKWRKTLCGERAPGHTATITLRLAIAEDTAALERLAALYDRPLLAGPALLALVDGELQAALTLAGDRELMEPFLPTAGLVDLLALRAQQLREQTDPPTAREPGLALRTAPTSRAPFPSSSRRRDEVAIVGCSVTPTLSAAAAAHQPPSPT